MSDSLSKFITSSAFRSAHSVRRAAAPAGLPILALLAVGCGGGGVGGDVSLSEALRQDIDDAAVSRSTLTVPGSAEMNYASFRSGQTGLARGESHKAGANGARCRAECEPDGAAWGEFQIGYSFDNRASKALDAIVKLRLKVTETRETAGRVDEGIEKSTSAKAALRFFIKDTYGIEHKSVDIITSSLALGPKFAGREQEFVFDARFEPERGYYLIIAGRSEVSSEKGAKASAAVEVADAALEIVWTPPAAASAAGGAGDALASGDGEAAAKP